MAREINLVPEVKDEMIKALKIRNYIMFISIVVAAASVGITVIFGLIMGGQQLARDGKNKEIENLSSKLTSYKELNQTLTIKDQIGNVDTLTSNKRVFTRTFSLLSAILPTGADTIKISQLNIYRKNKTLLHSMLKQMLVKNHILTIMYWTLSKRVCNICTTIMEIMLTKTVMLFHLIV